MLSPPSLLRLTIFHSIDFNWHNSAQTFQRNRETFFDRYNYKCEMRPIKPRISQTHAQTSTKHESEERAQCIKLLKEVFHL